MLEYLLTLQFIFLNFSNFMTTSYYNMMTIHTHVTNPLYFLIINFYYMYMSVSNIDCVHYFLIIIFILYCHLCE